MEFGPGEAALGARTARLPRSRGGRADFKVLVWYRRDDALGTFKYQVYDLRKREYTPAVDVWVRDLQTRYPWYIVLIRDVDLQREKGETDSLKVGSVVRRELMVAAALAGIVPGAPPQIGPGPSAGQGQVPQVSRMPSPDRSFLLPSSTTPRIPIYPRTHPP
jgi:hypothetical protein